MEPKKDTSKAEFEIMNILWEKGQARVSEVQLEICKNRRVAYTTVATLMTRLREKGYVKAREKNFCYIYSPTVEREQVVRRKVDNLIDLVFSVYAASLAAYIVDNEGLTQGQIEILEKIVKSK